MCEVPYLSSAMCSRSRNIIVASSMPASTNAVHRGARWRRLLLIAIVDLVVIVTLLELALQGVRLAGTASANPVIHRIAWRLLVTYSWEEAFLARYLSGTSLVYAGIHRPHPTRGWAMNASSTSQPAPGTRYTTNAQAYRALYDYRYDPSRYGVLIVGDSFTFGDDVDDTMTWPHLLQARTPALNVLNMGGTGYGLDQMLITLEEEIQRYRPRLVVCAFITDDLGRSILTFRDFAKPMFVLTDGGLKLTNTPIGDVDSVVDTIASHRDRFYCVLELSDGEPDQQPSNRFGLSERCLSAALPGTQPGDS